MESTACVYQMVSRESSIFKLQISHIKCIVILIFRETSFILIFSRNICTVSHWLNTNYQKYITPSWGFGECYIMQTGVTFFSAHTVMAEDFIITLSCPFISVFQFADIFLPVLIIQSIKNVTQDLEKASLVYSISRVVSVFVSLVLCITPHIDVQKSLIIPRTQFWPPRCPLSKVMFIPAWQRSECIGVFAGDLKNTCHYFSYSL